MNKYISILSLSCLFMLPPMLPSVGSFKSKVPDMAKGFKKSFFDKETREFCEKKMKEPINFKTAKMEHNGPVLGEALYQGVHMAFAAGMGYVAQKALSGAATAVNDTRDFIAAKNAGGVKGAVANSIEAGVMVVAPAAYLKGALVAAETAVTVEGYVAGYSGKSSASNPFVVPPPTPLPPLTGPGTTSVGAPWITEAHVAKATSAAKYAGPVVSAATYGAIKGTKVETGLSAMASDLSSWNASSDSTKAAVVLAGSAASQGLGSTSIFAAVEITAQAARAWGYAQFWCP